jgi:nucleoside-diphosphate-sugar epimerase
MQILENIMPDSDWRRTCTFIIETDPSDLEKHLTDLNPDAFLHIAAYGRYSHKSDEIDKMLEANIRLGTHLLEIAANLSSKDNRKPFIYCGSYWQHSGEDARYCPNSLYAATKTAFDAIAHYYNRCRCVATLGLKFYDIYGPNDPRKRILDLMIESLNNETPQGMSKGEQKLSLLFVEDAVRAVFHALSLINNDLFIDRTYGVMGTKPLNLREICETLERITGKKANIDWGHYPYRNYEIFDPFQIKSLPNWAPETTLTEGIKKLLQ